MPLEEYRTRRDFEKTREPSGAEAGPHHGSPIFVVQEHHASHLHYDFRLEADGVLKSWSVPKGPSMDPSVKRLAVQVEDHPLSYASFQGSIPAGQYGGGTVKIWDHGTYESLADADPASKSTVQAIEGGRLDFVMHGQRLKGKFALIRMNSRGRGKPQWLLIKAKDEFAAAEGEVGPEGRNFDADGASASPRRVRPARTSAPNPKAQGPSEPHLSHPDRLVYPQVGLTKADVFAYYRRIAGHLLPYLKDRPITLERLPEGLIEGGPHFWQKETPDHYPDWIPRVALPTESGKLVKYALVNDASSLLFLVNQGAITFHAWASRTRDLDRPDFVLFDLDPGDAPFDDVVAIAHAVKDALAARGASAYVKTSGKAGLHVLTPWGDGGHFDEARAWALDVAREVASGSPRRATVEIRKAKRAGRVYIDVLQNARGHHAVPPYVLRAVPGATVSAPLAWREVKAGLSPAAFTLKRVLARVARLKADPLTGLLESFSSGGTI